MLRLKGKRAVITGASSGVGRAVAIDLARHGVDVALLARGEEGLNLTAEAAAKHGVKTLVVPVDISIAGDVAAAFERVRRELGEPDILVNAAGLGIWKPFGDITDEEHREMMDVNYWGTFHCVREVLTGMRARRCGAIVNISSGTGKFALSVTSGYSASKFAVTGFSEALYRELRGSGVSVSCVHPGSIKTSFWSEERVPLAGLPPLVRYSPRLSPQAVARSVRHGIWLGFPALTTPVFVAFLAKVNAIWIRLGDLLLWPWLFPTVFGLLVLRIVLRRLVFPS